MTVPFKGGAPRKYQPEELTKKITEYFEHINKENNEHKLMDEKPRPYTITGLCNYLDIVRDTWIDYGKKQEYADSIKKAKLTIEQHVEEGLLSGSLNVIGSIFNLKNNFGWVDKIEVRATSQPEQLTPEEVRRHLEQRKLESASDEV